MVAAEIFLLLAVVSAFPCRSESESSSEDEEASSSSGESPSAGRPEAEVREACCEVRAAAAARWRL